MTNVIKYYEVSQDKHELAKPVLSMQVKQLELHGTHSFGVLKLSSK